MASIGSVEVALKGLVWQCDTGIEHFGSHLADVEEEISTLIWFYIRFYGIDFEVYRVELLVLLQELLRLCFEQLAPSYL